MRRPMDKKRRNKMIASYLADWVLTIFLWVSRGFLFSIVKVIAINLPTDLLCRFHTPFRQFSTSLTRFRDIVVCSPSQTSPSPIRMQNMSVSLYVTS